MNVITIILHINCTRSALITGRESITRDTMKNNKITRKEYEALATMRDIAVLLYAEISENLGYESKCLCEAFEVLNQMAESAGRDQPC